MPSLINPCTRPAVVVTTGLGVGTFASRTGFEALARLEAALAGASKGIAVAAGKAANFSTSRRFIFRASQRKGLAGGRGGGGGVHAPLAILPPLADSASSMILSVTLGS